MIKRRECEEIVTDTDSGKSYLFAGTFGFISMLALAGRDPSFIFEDLASGLLPPEEIKNVIKFSIEQVDGADIDDSDREAVAVAFVESAGLTDSSIIARLMMSHAMVGSVKKKQIKQREKLQGILFKSKPSPWKIYALVGVSLGGSLSGLIALVCTIFRYL